MTRLIPWLTTVILLAGCYKSIGAGEDDPDTGNSDTDSNTSADADADSDGDADMDTDADMDSDTGPDAGSLLVCSEPAAKNCEDMEDPRLPILVDGSAILEDLTFIDIASGSGSEHEVGVLATGMQGSENRTVLFVVDLWELDQGRESGTYNYLTYEGDDSPIPVALTSNRDDTLGDNYIALICGDDVCFLAGSAATASEPAPLEAIGSSEFPFEAKLNDLDAPMHESGINQGKLWAVGDGVFSFDTTQWSIAIKPGMGALFNAIDLEFTWSGIEAVAVGDQGRIATLLNGAWTEPEIPTTADLVDVSICLNVSQCQLGQFSAVGQGGVVIDGIAHEHIDCNIFDGDLLSVKRYDNGYARDITIIGTSGGKTVRRSIRESRQEQPGFCRGASTSEPIIQALVFPTGCSSNEVFLTKTAILGYVEPTINCP